MRRPDPALQRRKQRAVAALQADDLTEAVRLLEKVCRKQPRDGQAWFLLSAAHGQGGNFQAVIQCCRRILRLDPQHVEAHTNLANAYASLGAHDEAMAAYGRALSLSPDDPNVLHNLGSALLKAGKTEEGVARLEEAVRLNPRASETHFNLARGLARLGRYPEAVRHYQAGVNADPEQPEPRLELAKLFAGRGNLGPAEQCYREVAQRWPESKAARFGLCMVFRYRGDFDLALAECERILEGDPHEPRALSAIADLRERMGEREAAYQILRGLLDCGRVNSTAVDVYTRLCLQHGDPEEAIKWGRRLADGSNIAVENRREVLYALGRLFDKLGRYDEAFESFRLANDLCEDVFDLEIESERFDGLIAAFAADAVVNMARASVVSDRPIFIVGMPRSGTTLVEQILASHPLVFGAGELNDINDLVQSLPKTLYPACMESTT